MNSVITTPTYMPLPSLCLILVQCPKTVLPKDSGHTWSEIGNIWILTLYGFVGYTYKQNAESIFYHWSDHCTCHSMSWWLQAFYAKDTFCILKSTCSYTSTHFYTQFIMARTSEPKRMQLSKESQYLGLNFSSFTVYLDILHEITVTIQNICHLFIMSIWEIWQYQSIIFFKQDPNKLTETQNKDGYKYSFLTFIFGIKSDITLMCVCEKLVTK